jgi:maltokinase
VVGSLARTLPSLRAAVARFGRTALGEQRWFAGKGRMLEAVELVDAAEVPDSGGAVLAIAGVRYRDGGLERYLLPGRVAPDGSFDTPAGDDRLWGALARAMVTRGHLEGDAGAFAGRSGAVHDEASGESRLLTLDQSNTSVVIGERLVLKCYRRLESGTHPEPELLEALTRAGCRVAPRWQATLSYRSDDLDAGVAALYAYVPGAPVGWEPVIERLRTAIGRGEDDEGLLGVAGALGATTAELHRSLAAAFGTSIGDVGAVRAARDDALAAAQAAAAALPQLIPGDAAAIVHERLTGLRALAGATLSRVHGDLHVAQFVDSQAGLVVVDFEGEPDRPLVERRAERSPLRDLACLLLSLDHVAAAAARRHGFGIATERAFAWSEHAREHALAAYGETVDRELLHALEIEKECRELLYAVQVLPEWLYAPSLVLPRLLGVKPS